MIQARIMFSNDVEIAVVWLREKPSVGEYLWLTGETTRQSHGATSFTVTEVAHWLNEAWNPATHTGEPIHSLAIYVERTDPNDTRAQS